MLSRYILLTLLLAALEAVSVSARSAGCGKAPIQGGSKTMTVNGKQRQYIIDIPTGYNPQTAHKLIFTLHYRGGSATDTATGRAQSTQYFEYNGLKRLSGGTAIFVAPNGLGSGWGNAGGEDVTFMDQIIATLEKDLCIDETQRFAHGFSFGAGMSYALACARAKTYRAVALNAGAQISGCSGGNDPIAFLGMHGVSDGTLGIGGGRSLRDRFLKNNGCQAKNAPEPAAGSRTHIKTEYSCRAGYPVTWIAYDGGHEITPADGAGRDANGAEKARVSYGPGEVWKFFNQFSSGSAPPPTGTPPPPTGSPPPTGNPPPPPPPPPSTPPPSGCSALYGQCGGASWTGAKCCSQGTCKFSNDWYSQCL